jgi:hypothetical protein
MRLGPRAIGSAIALVRLTTDQVGRTIAEFSNSPKREYRDG